MRVFRSLVRKTEQFWDYTVNRIVSQKDNRNSKQQNTTRLEALALEERVVPEGRPLPYPVIGVAPGSGAGLVELYDADNGAELLNTVPFENSFHGGIRVAVGDVTRDTFPDYVVAAGPGGGPRVRTFDGKTGQQMPGPLGNFFAYDPSFLGGVNVAIGDTNSDGYADIITSADEGGGPHIKIFDGKTGNVSKSFFAFEEEFRGGVRIATGSFLPGTNVQLVVSAGPGGGPRVRILDLTTLQSIPGPLGDFYSYDKSYTGGVYVTTGSVRGNGLTDLIVGSGLDRTGQVKAYDGSTGQVIRDFEPFGAQYTSGVRVGTAWIDDDAHSDIVVGSGPGVAPQVKSFSGLNSQQLTGWAGQFEPGVGDSIGGVNIAAGNDPIVVNPTLDIQSRTVRIGDPVRVNGTTTFAPDADSSTRYLKVGTSWFKTASTTIYEGGAGSDSFSEQLSVGSSSNDATLVWEAYHEGMPGGSSGEISIPITITQLPEAKCPCGTCPTDPDANVSGTGLNIGSGIIESQVPQRRRAKDGPVGRRNYINILPTTPEEQAEYARELSRNAFAEGERDMSNCPPTIELWSNGGRPSQLLSAPVWSNNSGFALGSNTGNGRLDRSDPKLFKSGSSLVLLINKTTPYYFDGQGSPDSNGNYETYLPRFYMEAEVEYNSSTDEFLLSTIDGSETTFAGFGPTRTAGYFGKLIERVEADGTTLTVLSRDSLGRLTELVETRTVSGTTVQDSLTYEYYPAGNPNVGQLWKEIKQEKVGTGSWAEQERAEYSYYTPGESDGRVGDLKLWTLKDPSGGVIDRGYYRYTNDTDSKLEYALGSDAFERAKAHLGGTDSAVFTSDDIDLSPFADGYYEYNSEGLVSLVRNSGTGCSACNGGQGTVTYSYLTSEFSDDFNSWKKRTVEAFQDGTTNTYYTNAYGQTILRVLYDASTAQTRRWYHRYDEEGRVVFGADPNAVYNFDESYPDLVNYNAGNAQYINDFAGRVSTVTYYSSTTATDTSAGGVAGYQESVSIQQGELGTAIPQLSETYFLRSAGSASVVFIASQTKYRNTDGTGSQTTSAAYTWYSGTVQPQQITLTLPTVSNSQNGPGTASTITGVFDQSDQLIWLKSPTGVLSYFAYDPSSGAATTYLEDVNTTITSDFSNLPSGWSTPSGAGQHRKTTAEVDWRGRLTRVTDPLGIDSFAVYNDAAHEARYYLGWNPSTNSPTGPTWIERKDPGQEYHEILSISATPNVTSGKPNGTESISGLQSLLRIGLNDAGQEVKYDSYFNLSGLTYSTSSTLGTVNTHFYRSQQGYDQRGRPNRTVSPAGTIQRTVNDALGNPLSIWVGTNDTPTTGWWSTSNPADLTKVASASYDANGNQESVTLYPGGSLPNSTSNTYFDWRNRPVLVKEGVESSESTSVNRPITYIEYDNLNQITRSKLYDGDGVSISSTAGVPNAPSSSLLRGQGEASYDEWGQVYELRQYGVSSSGTPTSTPLTTRAWHDELGQIVKVAAPGGLVQKLKYDSVGRAIATNLTDGGGDTGYSDALTVTGDTVLSQAEYSYNSRDELLQVTTRERFHNASGTGALGTPTTGVNARVSYYGLWYDNLGRTTASADVGTNDNTAWTRPTSVPARGDKVLVSSQTFDAAGNVLEVTDPLGIVNRSSYDALGRMTSQTAAYGTSDAYSVSFAYGTNGLTSITAPGSRTTSQSYDSWGRVNAITEYVGTAFERSSSWTMDNLGQTLTMTDPLGTVSSLSYNVLGQGTSGTAAYGTSLARTASVTYDVFGRMLSATDPRGNSSTMSYDDVARTITSTDALSNSSTIYFDDAGNVTKATNALNNSTTASYDLLGRATSVTDPLSRTTSFQYNVSGDRDITVDALSNNWTSVYDLFGRTSQSIDPLSRSVSYGYDRNSQMVSFTDAKGTPTQFQYDNLGRTTKVTEAVGYSEQRSTSYNFNSSGDLASVVNPRGYTTAYNYDAAGRVSSVTAASGESVAQTVSVAYDKLDRVTSVTRPGSRTTGYTYDVLSQVTKVTEGVGTSLERSSSFTYDENGNQTKFTNPLNFSTSISYDKLNRPTTQTDANGGVTTLGYDAIGQTVSVQDPTGNTTSFAYDAAGQLTSQTDPRGKSASYNYDAVGQLTKVTDRLGRERRFTYDAAGQRTAEDWYTSGSKVQSQTFGYDANGNLTSATDPDGSYTMSYDRLNRTTSVQQPFGMTLSMAYDANDNRVSVSDSAGGSQTSTYDAMDRLSVRQMSNTGQDPLRVTWGYSSAGDVSTITREAKVSGSWTTTGVTTQTFDDLGRRTNIRHADASNKTIGEYGYSFDAGDRITSESINGTTRTYSYDDINQVTSDNGTSLSYDKSGNRTMSGYTTDTGNRVTSDGTWTYTYDDAGQMVKKSKGISAETWVYSYDHAGQMTSASKSNTDGGTVTDAVSYSFDAFGNRLQRQATSGSTTTTERFAYDGWDTAKPGAIGSENFDVYADLNSSNSVTNRRLFGPSFDEPIARQDSSGVVAWYGTDQLGSVRTMFDNSGTVTGSRSYSGFGEIVSETGTGLDRYAYTAREWDSAIGLQYSRARMYDPKLGRWTSEDPLGFGAGDSNLSRYVGNGATLASDPSGMNCNDEEEKRLPRLPPGIEKNIHPNKDSQVVITLSPEDLTKAKIPKSITDFEFKRGAKQIEQLSELENILNLKEPIEKYEIIFKPWTDEKTGKAVLGPNGKPVQLVVIVHRATKNIVRVGWQMDYYGTIYGVTFFDDFNSMAKAYKLFTGILIESYSVTLFSASLAVGLAPEIHITRAIKAPATPKPVHIDIGGEGRYPGAINVNPSPVTSTTGTPGRPIPNRVAGTGEKLPQANQSADLITVENTPISPGTAGEIARVIKPGGEIRLVGPADYAKVAHQRVIKALPPGATVTQTTVGTGETAITTTIIKLP